MHISRQRNCENKPCVGHVKGVDVGGVVERDDMVDGAGGSHLALPVRFVVTAVRPFR